MEKEIEPMDILRAPTRKEIILAQIAKWVMDSYFDDDHRETFIFKKNTPPEILKTFQKYSSTLFSGVNKNYQIQN